MFSTYKKVSLALLDLLRETNRYSKESRQKVLRMQDLYLEMYPNIYDESEKVRLKELLENALGKFYYTTLALEQMWSLSHYHRDEIINAKIKDEQIPIYSEAEMTLASWSLENFLFQARSFIDFYISYLWQFMKLPQDKAKHISIDVFYKEINFAIEGGDETKGKINTVKEYFQKKIYDNTKGTTSTLWGNVLTHNRNKITHREPIQISYGSKELLLKEVLFDWPTIEGMTYDRFCQEVQNEMFFLLHDLSSILYELEWKTGPYNPDLWD